MSYKSNNPMIWKGTYSGATAYEVNDAVVNGGVQYVCISPTTGNAPPNATYWELAADDQSAGVNEHSEDLTESSSSSSTWAQKLRHTTANLASGTYKVSVFFVLRSSANNQQMECRAQIDDTTAIGTIAYELRPGSAAVGEGASHSLKWVGNLSGVTNIDVDFRRPSGTNTVYISNVHVFVEEF